MPIDRSRPIIRASAPSQGTSCTNYLQAAASLSKANNAKRTPEYIQQRKDKNPALTRYRQLVYNVDDTNDDIGKLPCNVDADVVATVSGAVDVDEPVLFDLGLDKVDTVDSNDTMTDVPLTMTSETKAVLDTALAETCL